MQLIDNILNKSVSESILSLYGQFADPRIIQLQKTRREFEGDITLVVFPLLKLSRKSPDDTALDIGNYLHKNIPDIIRFNVVKGFLNLVISDSYYLRFLNQAAQDNLFGFTAFDGHASAIMVEYSSPNTNKPLHLGHLRRLRRFRFRRLGNFQRRPGDFRHHVHGSWNHLLGKQQRNADNESSQANLYNQTCS